MTPYQKWLKRRREILGASDAAAVLGLDRYRGKLKVWANKVHGIETVETRPMRYGSYMEDFISDEYEMETGRDLANPGDFEITMHPDIKYIGATLDRTAIGNSPTPAPADGLGATELKALSSQGCTVEQWNDSPPIGYQIQLQIQIACMQAFWGTLVAWIDGANLVWTDFLRDDELLELIYPELDEFWWHVKKKIPPIDDAKNALEVSKKIYRKINGTTIQLTDSDRKKADAWEHAGERRNYWTKEEKELQGQLRFTMEDNSFGDLQDGTYLQRKVIQQKDGREHVRMSRIRPRR
jgi:putative phage-type endonuclease